MNATLAPQARRSSSSMLIQLAHGYYLLYCIGYYVNDTCVHVRIGM